MPRPRTLAQALDTRLEGEIALRRGAAEDGARIDSVWRAALAMAQRFARRGRLLIVGAPALRSDIAHLAVEFSHPSVPSARSIATLSVVAPTPDIVEQQLEQLGREGDVCVAMAPATTDAILWRALGVARRRDLVTIALVSEGGGGVPLADHVIVAGGGGGTLKESLVTAYHVLWEMVHAVMAGEPVAS
ncbi:MAG TPA: hypothetical protein VFR41_14455 [Acidimicrobiia bacterium]|nr:hypothetical protein [Acidimicrobiia bacterium]